MRITHLLFLLPCLLSQARASTLFYNGSQDPTASSFLNCMTCRGSNTLVYDNFVVGPGGWTINTITADLDYNTFAPATLTAGYFEIRQGVASGTGGTALYSGSTSISSVTPLGTSGNTSFARITMNVGSISLTPGTYWMAFAPVTVNDAYLTITQGAGGVNAVIDGTSFVNGLGGVFNWRNVGNYLQPFTSRSNYDFAYGLQSADAIPEPSTSVLLLSGAALFAFKLRKARQSSSR